MNCNYNGKYAAPNSKDRRRDYYMYALLMSATDAAACVFGYKNKALQTFTDGYGKAMREAFEFCDGYGHGIYLQNLSKQHNIDIARRKPRYIWHSKQKRVVDMVECSLVLALIDRHESKADIIKTLDLLEDNIGRVSAIDEITVGRMKHMLAEKYNIEPIFK